ncbi:phosphatidate cytidylyltransferase [Euryarchaeota archaeon ex4484_178]|nr:MAG: phosphatidate cytidylyltransferase [Euryarchaeota archaeon ex4484_178]
MSLKAELKRKALHLSGLLIPLSYFYFGKDLTIIFIAIALIAFFIIEPFRTSQKLGKDIVEGIRPFITREIYKFLNESMERIDRRIREIAREEENICIGAHVYFAIASLIVIILFPMYIAISAIAVATLGDAVAAIIGKSLGKHRFKNGKSVEGSSAFFIVALLLLLWILPMGYTYPYVIYASITGAIIGTVVEFYDFPPNDNFSNQIFISLALYILTLF